MKSIEEREHQHRKMMIVRRLVNLPWRSKSENYALRVPNGGIQPQAVMDAKGTLHFIYIKGDAKQGSGAQGSKVEGF
jgi:hypothetical protein